MSEQPQLQAEDVIAQYDLHVAELTQGLMIARAEINYWRQQAQAPSEAE